MDIRKSPKFYLTAAALFVAAETVLYILIHWSQRGDTAAQSYASVVLCFAFVLLFLRRDARGITVAAAFVFTLVADYFLVLNDDSYEAAVAFFFCTQLCYAVRLHFMAVNRVQKILNISLRLVFTAIIEIAAVIVLREENTLLAAMAVCYAANLAANAVTAFILFRQDPLFGPGLLLFLLCDLCIGISFLPELGLPLTGIFLKMASSPVNWAWIFYLPSQVLIALSTLYGIRSASSESIPVFDGQVE